jgi:hypothetical protein
MNFARCKCDARVLQGLMHDSAFALHIGNETRCPPRLSRAIRSAATRCSGARSCLSLRQWFGETIRHSNRDRAGQGIAAVKRYPGRAGRLFFESSSRSILFVQAWSFRKTGFQFSGSCSNDGRTAGRRECLGRTKSPRASSTRDTTAAARQSTDQNPSISTTNDLMFSISLLPHANRA